MAWDRDIFRSNKLWGRYRYRSRNPSGWENSWTRSKTPRGVRSEDRVSVERILGAVGRRSFAPRVKT